MVSSFGFSLILLILARNGVVFTTHAALLMTVGVTTVCWLLAAYLAPQTDPDVLVAFYRKVRPFGPGWAPVRARAGALPADEHAAENIPMALLGWFAGCTAIWSSLFAVGNFLYGRTGMAWLLTAVFAVSGLVVIKIVARLWTAGGDR
jgi:hypothetical protein